MRTRTNRSAGRLNGLLIFLTVIAAIFTLSPSYASERYDDMKAAYNNRTGVSYYSSDIEMTAPLPAAPDNSGMDKELNALNNLIDNWSESLKSSEPTDFYPHDLKTLKLARGVYEDEEKIRIMLKDKASLDELVAVALLRNPMIRAAKKNVRAAYERFSQVNNLELIMRDYLAFTNTLTTITGPKKNKKMIGMEFPFPGMTTLKGDIIDKDITIASLKLERVRIKVVTKLKKAHYDLLYIMKEEEITKSSLRLLKELEQVANVKYETGKTSFNDVIKVQIKLEALKDMLKTISERKANVQVMIAKLLSLPPDIRFGEPVPVRAAIEQPLDEIYKIGAERNIDVIIINEKVKRMALMIEMAKKRAYPDFSMGYSYFNGDKFAGSMMSADGFMTSPMIDHNKNADYARNDAYIREVQEKLAAHLEMLNAKRDEIAFKIKDASYHIDKASREMALYKDNLIPKSKKALEVAKIGYETGRVSFLDALDADMMWLKFNIEYFKAVRHRLVSIADMESATSVPLSVQ